MRTLNTPEVAHIARRKDGYTGRASRDDSRQKCHAKQDAGRKRLYQAEKTGLQVKGAQ